MVVGYARVSTRGQSYESQLEALKQAGATKIFAEKVSGAKRDRPRMAELLDFLHEGDVVVVTKLDRLARSTSDLLRIAAQIGQLGADLKILNINIDTATPTGKFTFTLLGAVATFEREIMLERQAEGLERAKAEGKFLGRAPTARAKTDAVLASKMRGLSNRKCAELHGISESSVRRILKAVKGT